MPLREKTLWRLLYESAARADSVLSLDIEDLDRPAKRGKITAKGGVVRWIQWQSGAARLPGFAPGVGHLPDGAEPSAARRRHAADGR